ncbi:hypothetical protein Y032_0004g1702 [Ancylostoma ceylanicum]|uniref:Uncharacterized protein n=1 Tax=Ancylostoma ceylanicum TaxID=53326 RepID=A0A016VTL9_9BILA|nr:hypothetical protein Y032_0004g1702 [Ancylostoma ceylanicum]
MVKKMAPIFGDQTVKNSFIDPLYLIGYERQTLLHVQAQFDSYPLKPQLPTHLNPGSSQHSLCRFISRSRNFSKHRCPVRSLATPSPNIS